MKKLALLLCAILVTGVVGTGVLAKKGGNGKTKGKGYGRGGRFVGPPEWAGSDHDDTDDTQLNTDDTEQDDTEQDDTEQVEAQDSEGDQDDQQTGDTEETEEDDGNGKAFGKNKETPKSPADYNGLNKPGNSRHLYLYEKNPDDWSIVEDGAWGKMTYRPVGKTLRFVFTGHGLEAGVDYTLIYYPEPWPGEGLVCLGSATANQGGQVHISDRVDAGDIPMEGDENGGKIWLVLSDDVDCDDDDDGTKMVGWNPTEYLFEYNVITFEDTDDGAESEGTESSEETQGE